MPTVAVKLSLEDISSVLEQLSESEMKKILERIRDRRKKVILEQGYRQLAKLTFEDIGCEEEWVRVENEAIESFERELS